MRHSSVNEGLRSVALSGVCWALLFTAFQAVLSSAAVGQDGPTAPNVILSTSFSYQSLPVYGDLSHAWDIAYFGVSADASVTSRISFSGSIYGGKGSDDVTYFHFPAAGPLLFLPFAAVGWLLQSLKEWEFSGLTTASVEGGSKRVSQGKESKGFDASLIWKTLLMEAVHYNIPAGKVLVISPYVNVLSFDTRLKVTTSSRSCSGGTCTTSTSSPDTTASPWMLSTGLGLNVKVFLLDRFVVTPDVNAKYFFVSGDPVWGNEDRFGYMLGLHIGYVF